MEASKQEVYFIAIRMQAGAIRRELPLIGLGERAHRLVSQVLDAVEAQVRDWGVDRMVTPQHLQEVLGALMRMPGELRAVVEAGQEASLTLEVFEAVGLLPPREQGGGSGTIN